MINPYEMTEEEILNLCDSKVKYSGKTFWIYWTIELYAKGRYIREYAFLPAWLPLVAYCDHGSGMSGRHEPQEHELKTDAPVLFFYSKNKCLRFKELSNKPTFVLLNPSVYFRRSRKLKQFNGAKGTIAFAAHSTPAIDIENACDFYANYAKQLKKLPDKFQPITICLHMHDINKGFHRIFMDSGLPVVTAGNTTDYRFLERFYNILCSYKYATSTMAGAYTSLAIEMDIPFFFYGIKPALLNKRDKNFPQGVIRRKETVNKLLYESLSYENFNGMVDPGIKRYVELEMGVYDTISRFKAFLILWGCFFWWLFRYATIKKITRFTMRKIKKLFSKA